MTVLFGILAGLTTGMVGLVLSADFSTFFFTWRAAFLRRETLFLRVCPVVLLVSLVVGRGGARVVRIVNSTERL